MTPTRLAILGAVLGGLVLVAGAKAQLRTGGEPSLRPTGDAAIGLSPEDIVAVPGTRWLVAGALPGTDAGSRGGIALIDTARPGNIRALYPSPSASDSLDKVRFPDCPGPLPSGFSPHGVNLERQPDGSYEILAINHRGRESIEVFHLSPGSSPGVIWRGCVVLPAGASGNSVAPLLDHAGYIVTNFIQRPNPDFLRDMANGTATGNVLKWTRQAGWSDLSPQRFSGANGVEVSADGKWVFVSEWSGYKVWKLAVQGNAPPKSIPLDFLPDNLRWTGHGTILIAGQNADPVNVMTCRRTHEPCQAPFTVLEMNPDTMETRVLARGGDAGFGGATGSAMVGKSLWVSSYYSERVARFALP